MRGFRWRTGVIGMAVMAGSGCSLTGSTMGSGVGDTFLPNAPYYAGATRGDVMGRSLRVGHLPVVYQRGAAQAPIFDPGASETMRGLLSDLTTELKSMDVSGVLLEEGPRAEAARSVPAGAPDVSFGCITPSGAAGEECTERGDSALGRGDQRMRLAVTRASEEWTGWLRDRLVAADLDAALVITLEVGQYLIRQRGVTGQKEVELGSAHVVQLPWLTSLGTPVQVLQLTGALIGRDGKAIRIGAEGLFARRTPLAASAAGAQQLISDADVEALRTARREDLNGTPLTWQTGIRTLAGELVGRGPLAVPRRPM